MSYVIGIDAGGTKTVGLLADETGQIHAKARGGGANLLVHGELGVEKVLYQVIEDLEIPEPVEGVCLGMAGVDRPGDRELLRQVFLRLGQKRRVRIENDAFVALVAGAPAGEGVVVAAGTGSIAYGVDSTGNTARSGGWGYLLGDEGSAFWLGHAAVRAGIRALDGRGPQTRLFERIAEKLDLEVPAGLVAWFYDQELSRYRVAKLATIVEEVAADGDLTAQDLLDQAALHLARAARAVTKQLEFPDAYPLVLSGGTFKACPSLYERLEARLDLPNALPVRLEAEPATGAVRLALEQLS